MLQTIITLFNGGVCYFEMLLKTVIAQYCNALDSVLYSNPQHYTFFLSVLPQLGHLPIPTPGPSQPTITFRDSITNSEKIAINPILHT